MKGGFYMSQNSNNKRQSELTPQERSELIRKYQRRKSLRSFFIILFVIFSVFAFTGLAIWLQFYGNVELSATLITCFYAFCTGELWMLASIKKAKIYKDIDNDGIPDEIDDHIDVGNVDESEYNRGIEDALQKISELLGSESEDN
jgi:hypothetical protein